MSGQPFRARFGFDAMQQQVVNVQDGTALLDAVNLGQLQKAGGVQVVPSMAYLPDPNDADQSKRPKQGQTYLVLTDDHGGPLNRLLTWKAPATVPTGGVLEVAVLEPAADAALIAAQAGVSDAGKPFTAGGGTGAVLTLTAQADGQITGVPTAPGTGYTVGDSAVYAAGSLAFGAAMTGDTRVVVTKIDAPQSLGGWVASGIASWVKPLNSDPSATSGPQKGDLELTLELNKEVIRTWDGSNWVQLYSTAAVDARIAALSLFEGTVKQVGGAAVPGAVDFTALPDLTDNSAPAVAAALANVSHYWTWVGTAGYVIQVADVHGVGADLSGAVMQVGDWVQLSNRGGDGSGVGANGGPPDLHWVHIGGDLLAKSRADVLYGLRPWAAGNYEAGSLLDHNGAIYRATGMVVPGDGAPGTAGAPWAKIALNIQQAGDFQLLDNPGGTGKLALQNGETLVWNTDHFEPRALGAANARTFTFQCPATGFDSSSSLKLFTTGTVAYSPCSYIVDFSDITNANVPQAHYRMTITAAWNGGPFVQCNLLNASVEVAKGTRAVWTVGLNSTSDEGLYIVSDGNKLNGSKWRVTVYAATDLIQKLVPGDGTPIPAVTVHSEPNRSFPLNVAWPPSALPPRTFIQEAQPTGYQQHSDLWFKASTGELQVMTGDYQSHAWTPLKTGATVVSLTQVAYDALATKDPNTIYVIHA